MSACKEAIQKLATMGSLPASLQAMLEEALRKDEQHQGEPATLPARKPVTAGLLSESNTHNRGWNACLDEIAKLGPLYTHADPAEVERLRAELVEWKERCQRNSDEAMSWMGKHDTLRAQLAEKDSFIHDLETNCDPAGMVRENTLFRDQLTQCNAMIGRLKRELAERDALFARILGKRDACAASYWFDEIQTPLSASAVMERKQ